ncbi:Si-specific NAD(P)(+) transhydrogenase [candidate division KSB1 bacterium]|nr:Si-specific NAD(P)(+) transhydrogenase [candidate division KSB1 bacterium]
MNDPKFDLLVIGSGPAGQKGAIAAAKLGRRVAVIDRQEMIGGVSLHTGTIPSKTLREAILYLSGFRQRTFYGKDYRLKERVSVADLGFRVQAVLQRELQVVRAQLSRNGITTIHGAARFIDPHTLEVETTAGPIILASDYVLIACGTRAALDPAIPFDGKRIFNADQLESAADLPRRMIVVGAGVIGLEYASMLSALDIEVTIIDQRSTMLDFVDQEIINALRYHMQRQGTIFRLGEKVVSVQKDDREWVTAVLASGKQVHADCLLYAVGRQPNTDLLNLEAAGLSVDGRGRLAVNAHFQTTVPHIYAAGDVIGFPSLAASSMEQGRLAGSHMFGGNGKHIAENLPYGIYTIPEISMIGKTEQELTAAKIPYETGIAKYEELAKAQMLGDETGLLKILFDPASLKVLGVHVMGDRAAEIIHIGQAVIALRGTIEYFRDTVFNYPTMAEAYKVAALDGLNKL